MDAQESVSGHGLAITCNTFVRGGCVGLSLIIATYLVTWLHYTLLCIVLGMNNVVFTYSGHVKP